jgi:nucleoside-diphosphate-sugar epimerase
VIEKLERLLGKRGMVEYLPVHPADMVSTWADITKARRLLNWRPQTRLDDGLACCVQWYRDHAPWTSRIRLAPSVDIHRHPTSLNSKALP